MIEYEEKYMLTEERYANILSIIERNGSVTVQQLMKDLNASESTIRRDLNAMDASGVLTKVHGGAIAKNPVFHTMDENVNSRKLLNAEDKIRIAKYAAFLIQPNDFVYLDAGTTTAHMLDYIEEMSATYVTNAVSHAQRLAARGMKVLLIGGELLIDYIQNHQTVFVTNAISHAKKLADNGFRVYILGGEFKSSTEAIVGDEAVATVAKYNFTKGFWGTNGISVTKGFSTPEVKEAMVKKKSMENCKECYILADASKFSQISSVKFADFENATIITTQLNQKEFKNYKNIREVE